MDMLHMPEIARVMAQSYRDTHDRGEAVELAKTTAAVTATTTATILVAMWEAIDAFVDTEEGTNG